MLRIARASTKSYIRVVVALILGVIPPSSALAQQSIGLTFGGFFPRSETSRVPNDVLVNDLTISNRTVGLPDVLAFNVSDFRSGTVGAEYLVGLGDLFEAGLSGGF